MPDPSERKVWHLSNSHFCPQPTLIYGSMALFYLRNGYIRAHACYRSEQLSRQSWHSVERPAILPWMFSSETSELTNYNEFYYCITHPYIFYVIWGWPIRITRVIWTEPKLSGVLLEEKKLIRWYEFSEYLDLFLSDSWLWNLRWTAWTASKVFRSLASGLISFMIVRKFQIWNIVPDAATMCVEWRCSPVTLSDRPASELFPGI